MQPGANPAIGSYNHFLFVLNARSVKSYNTTNRLLAAVKVTAALCVLENNFFFDLWVQISPMMQ
jgi:hypothetical protein